MYQHSYADILADDAVDARAREREALDEAAARLRHAAEERPGSPAEAAALQFATTLWGTFIQDLAHPGNALPDTMRAGLMSIGLGVMAEAQRIEQGRSRDLGGIADICAIVRDGLR